MTGTYSIGLSTPVDATVAFFTFTNVPIGTYILNANPTTSQLGKGQLYFSLNNSIADSTTGMMSKFFVSSDAAHAALNYNFSFVLNVTIVATWYVVFSPKLYGTNNYLYGSYAILTKIK